MNHGDAVGVGIFTPVNLIEKYKLPRHIYFLRGGLGPTPGNTPRLVNVRWMVKISHPDRLPERATLTQQLHEQQTQLHRRQT